MNLINRITLLSIFLLLVSAQSIARQQVIYKKFSGTYVTGHQFGLSSFKLEGDGHFSMWSGSDDGTQATTSGTYTFSEGFLHFVVIQKTGKRRSEGRELNLFNAEDRKELFGVEGDKEPEREFKMLPVEWSGRIYLLHEKDVMDFANAVNLGLEPRQQLSSMHSSSPWYGSLYLRSGDESKKVIGKPRLPKEWQSFLLSKPVVAKVLSVEKTKVTKYITAFTATINIGSRSGLKVGMSLLLKDEEPSPWNGTKVISVAEKTAKIRKESLRGELKVGDKIFSRYVHKIPLSIKFNLEIIPPELNN